MPNEKHTGKEPYIPLYIGDWEKDTNMLSLEAEGGWMKIIFKMFQNGKTGVYTISTKGLQILWKKNKENVEEIIDELKHANICAIDYKDKFYTFKNRRMMRQYHISEIRSKAVQTRYK